MKSLFSFQTFGLLVVIVTLLGQRVFCASLSIVFTDNANNEEGFYVERSENNGTFARVATLPKSERTAPFEITWLDEGLADDTLYSYRVQAFNAAGVSLFSNTAAKRTPPASPPVTRPAAPNKLRIPTQ